MINYKFKMSRKRALLKKLLDILFTHEGMWWKILFFLTNKSKLKFIEVIILSFTCRFFLPHMGYELGFREWISIIHIFLSKFSYVLIKVKLLGKMSYNSGYKMFFHIGFWLFFYTILKARHLGYEITAKFSVIGINTCFCKIVVKIYFEISSDCMNFRKSIDQYEFLLA